MSEAKELAGHPIRVFLCDDFEVVRRGVHDLLEAEPDITVVGEAATASSALSLVAELKPDVAILDVRLPESDGVNVCRSIRAKVPGVACLILTAYDDDEALAGAIRAGAAGYLLKQVRGTDLAGAVRAVASGRSLLEPDALAHAMQRMRERAEDSDPLSGLTRREKTIFELVGQGLTNRQIGENLHLAEKTVKNYVSALYVKLGMQRRTQAAALAARTFPRTAPDGDQAARQPNHTHRAASPSHSPARGAQLVALPHVRAVSWNDH